MPPFEDKTWWVSLIDGALPKGAKTLNELRNTITRRIINSGPDSLEWRQGTMKIAQIDSVLSQLAPRRMFVIAIVGISISGALGLASLIVNAVKPLWRAYRKAAWGTDVLANCEIRCVKCQGVKIRPAE